MAWIAVVVSELVGVKSGLGDSLYSASAFGRIADVMIFNFDDATLRRFGNHLRSGHWANRTKAIQG